MVSPSSRRVGRRGLPVVQGSDHPVHHEQDHSTRRPGYSDQLHRARFGPAFLAFDNFQVYLKWNSSLVYSTTAAYYATRLAGAAPMQRGSGTPPPFSVEQTRELQQYLIRAGHDVGGADGKLGTSTRTAIRAMQIKFGLPADSYPTVELLERLRAGR